MKTRKIISVLRVAAECAALLLIVVVVMFFALQQPQFIAFAKAHWYIGAVVIFGYVALTFGEDYLNHRILRFG